MGLAEGKMIMDIGKILHEMMEQCKVVGKFCGRGPSREEVRKIVEVELGKRGIGRIGDWVGALRDAELIALYGELSQ